MAGIGEERLSKELVRIGLILVLGVIAPMLDTTMVNIAIDDFTVDFHASLDIIQWVITGYVLATGVAVPFSGWLIHRFDGKHIYLFAQALFLVASVLSGLAWNVESLIGFRLVQGFGAGLIIPLITTLGIQAAGPDNRGKLMSVVGLPIILGPILGPVIGGFLIEYFSWRSIFFVNVPVVIIVMIMIYRKLPSFPASNKQAKLDWIGILLLGGLSASFIYGITKAAAASGFGHADTIVFVGLGIALTAAYAIYAKTRSNQVIVPLGLFRFKSFSASICALFLAGIATNGPMLLLPLFFQNSRGYSVIFAGLALIPQGLGLLVARPLIGRLIDTAGAKLVVMIAIVITFAGTLPFLWISQSTSYWIIAVVLFIRGIGVGGITLPVMTDAFTGLSKAQIPQASSATRIAQNIGGAFGSAVLATVVASRMHHVAPNAAHLTSAYQSGFFVAMLLTVALFIPSLFLTNKAKSNKQDIHTNP